ncbi:spermatogenesis-associated protein 33 [Gracilinanus agilis]|uniref:spermatogenesis-associated protein 33 n=1 Tax=Gracilinanus agilis TaxID=191870 RepID=UPI001CFC4F5C|nr:spermatogenesis-associated protein 33 [Gracilinanus agilis]
MGVGGGEEDEDTEGVRLVREERTTDKLLHNAKKHKVREINDPCGVEMASESRNPEEDENKFIVPHIVVTRASNERLHDGALGQDIQRTIKDQIDYGPYYRHRNPSTIDAYLRKEPPKPK